MCYDATRSTLAPPSPAPLQAGRQPADRDSESDVNVDPWPGEVLQILFDQLVIPYHFTSRRSAAARDMDYHGGTPQVSLYLPLQTLPGPL